MYRRKIYLDQLIKLKGTEPVKVITGVRRCGKSTLLDLFEAHLLKTGVQKQNIIHINFELSAFDNIKNYSDLSEYLEPRVSSAYKKSRKKVYVILDEVQEISSWEKAINSLRAGKKTDIYITGSNANMLSSELATLLSGRYIQIKMLPLSFAEYLEFNRRRQGGATEALFRQFTQYGGFPGLVEFHGDEGLINLFLDGIYNTILMKDVVVRNMLRDADLLERIVKFVAGNIGSLVSSKKIANYLVSSGRKCSHETIDAYLNMLEQAFLLYKIRRYDIKGKEALKNQGKYYFVDTGLRYWCVGRQNFDMGSILENIVFLELTRRGFEVYTGKLPIKDASKDGDLEVDFIAIKNGIKTYYQVTYSMDNADVRERELRSLRLIDDDYEKFIVSMDKTPFNDYEGIRQINVIDFLVDTNFVT
jgi:predicted AAA+ superfamily ATPase